MLDVTFCVPNVRNHSKFSVNATAAEVTREEASRLGAEREATADETELPSWKQGDRRQGSERGAVAAPAWWWTRAAGAAALCAATACGNALVLRALSRAAPRAPAHYLLASLAGADLLLGLAVLPLAAARELYSFQLEHVWCKLWSTLDVMCCTASILSLCALGWERHEGVTRPLERARRTARARLVALLVWPLAAAVAAPAAFVPSPPHHHAGPPRACSVNTNVGYVLFSMTLSFYLPAGATLVLYWRVVRELRAIPPLRAHRGGSREPSPAASPAAQRSPFTQISWISPCKFRSPNQIAVKEENAPKLFLSPKGTHLGLPSLTYLGDLLTPSRSASPVPGEVEGSGGGGAGAAAARQVRATRTIVLIMGLFLLCWTPFFVVLPMDAVCGCVGPAAWSCASWLGYANSALNPLVYACTSPAVRRALRARGGTSASRSSAVVLPSPQRR